MRYHLTPSRMATINKSTNKFWQGCGEKGTPLHCQRECRLVHPLWKTVQSFLRKLKMELAFDPVILLLGIYPKNPESLIGKNIRTPMFIAALFAIAKICKQPKCPSVDEWIRKLWSIYIMEYYVAVEKKEILPFAQHGWNFAHGEFLAQYHTKCQNPSTEAPKREKVLPLIASLSPRKIFPIALNVSLCGNLG